LPLQTVGDQFHFRVRLRDGNSSSPRDDEICVHAASTLWGDSANGSNTSASPDR